MVVAVAVIIGGGWAVLRYLTQWEGTAAYAASGQQDEAPERTIAIIATLAPTPSVAVGVETPASPTPDPFDEMRAKPLLLPLQSEVLEEIAYENDSYLLNIQRVKLGETVSLVADIRFKGACTIATAFAKDTFGRNYLEKTSTIAKNNGAQLAINGDYYGYRDDGIIVREGKLYRNEPVRDMFCIYSDGRAVVVNEAEADVDAMLVDGLLHTFSFGPVLVHAFAPVEELKTDVFPKNPRSAIGMVSPGHFKLVVVDGRQQGYSEGYDMEELAAFMAGLGCEIAYNLDGGNTATMYYADAVISKPSGAGNYERTISDIIYLMP